MMTTRFCLTSDAAAPSPCTAPTHHNQRYHDSTNTRLRDTKQHGASPNVIVTMNRCHPFHLFARPHIVLTASCRLLLDTRLVASSASTTLFLPTGTAWRGGRCLPHRACCVGEGENRGERDSLTQVCVLSGEVDSADRRRESSACVTKPAQLPRGAFTSIST